MPIHLPAFIAQEKVAVYIDGSNLYNSLKDESMNPPNGKRFFYSAFVEYLIGKRQLVSKRYYVGIVRNFDHSPASEKRVRSQQKFLQGLRDESFVIKPGRIMYDQGKIREKGVDVKLSVDLIIGAIEHHYDTAILVSSDTDLIPAIQYARFRSKKIEYIGFSHRPSLGIQKHAHLSRLLTSQDIERFYVARD